MRSYFRLIIFTALILLSSCSNYSDYLEKERQLKSCHIKCNMKLDICNKQCKNNALECAVKANIEASKNFKRYKKREFIQGKVLIEELQSFKDPLQCRKVTCSCQEDFRVCNQSCRGKIYKHLKANEAFLERLNGT